MKLFTLSIFLAMCGAAGSVLAVDAEYTHDPFKSADRPPTPEQITLVNREKKHDGRIALSSATFVRNSTVPITSGDLYELVKLQNSYERYVDKIILEMQKEIDELRATVNDPFFKSVQISTAMLAQLPELWQMRKEINELRARLDGLPKVWKSSNPCANCVDPLRPPYDVQLYKNNPPVEE